MKFGIQSTVCDLDELFPVPQPPPAKQSASAWSLISAAHASTPELDQTSLIVPITHYADGVTDLKFGTLVTDSIIVTNLTARAMAKAGGLEVKPLTAQIYDGNAAGFFKLDATSRTGPYPIEMDIDVTDVEANTLLNHAFLEEMPIFGKMKMKLAMTGGVDSTLAVVYQKINAAGKMGMGAGRIVNWGWLKNALKDVQELGFLDFDNIPLKTMEAPFRISTERFHLDQISLTAADLACKVSGSLGFDGTLDTILDAWIPARRLNVGGVNVGNALSALLGQEERKIPIRVTFKGTTNKPRIALNIQQEGWDKLNQEVEKTEKKLLKDGQNLLKNLWKPK